ncbi:SWI/SNF complex component snf12 [Tulasnella sp. JGI-2019a]|nr:SWI/SNF complex component snf12 [Tulasnella sp. JGI-2019a]
MSNVNEAAVPPALKRRKLVDKSLPTALDEIAEENALYQELQRMERSLDWTMSRKRMEIQEAFGKPMKVRRKLRIFLSHAMSGQVWQEPSLGATAADLETGQPIPAWTFRIEGRLLDASTQRLNRGPSRKFSSFLKSMVVEFDRDPTLYPESNIVEWHRFDSPEAQDGFEIKRRGDMAVKARVILHLERSPDHFTVNNATLASLIGVQEDTRVGIIAGLWNYIKANGLQDKVHPTTIKFDQKLASIFNLVEINFSALPELVNRYLSPPDPILLQHVIQVEQNASPNMQAFDVDVDMDDTTLKQKMNQALLSYGAEAQATLTALDEEVAQAAQSVRNSKLKRDFLLSFAENPQKFIQSWIASQSRDLEVILGDDNRCVRDEDLRRSDFFRLPWVREAVTVYEGLRSSGALKTAQMTR